MVVPCSPCLNVPVGIDGHADLLVQGMGNAKMSFACRTCGSLWSRDDRRDGGFTWLGLDGQPVSRAALGMAVPPRSNPAPLFMWWPRDGSPVDGKAGR